MARSVTEAYRALNGIFCVYKPTGYTIKNIKQLISKKLSKDLNEMPGRPLRKMVEIHEENFDTDLPLVTSVPDISDHTLVVGPRYLPEDFQIETCGSMFSFSSGVLAVGIGSGTYKMARLHGARYLRVYHVKGQLGKATEDFTCKGRILERSTFRHVHDYGLDRVTAAIQGAHQRHQFLHAGVTSNSQEAYEIASRGLVRPINAKTPPIIYSIKCIEFNSPNFTLEIHSINENCGYLAKLIHEIGLDLRTNAVCTQIRRIRYGHFTLQHALLQKHWTVEHIIDNIDLCRGLVTKGKLKRHNYFENIDKTQSKDQLLLSDDTDQLESSIN